MNIVNESHALATTKLSDSVSMMLPAKSSSIHCYANCINVYASPPSHTKLLKRYTDTYVLKKSSQKQKNVNIKHHRNNTTCMHACNAITTDCRRP